ncbi:MAG: hypothetical protein GWP91_06075 [Rhodobacterales bacterium]|nr:hypothetical protein [Rhodobacterales bacterium]
MKPSFPLLRRADGSPRIVLNLRLWLAGSHLAVILLPLLVLLASGELAQDLRDQTRWDLEHQGVIISMMSADIVSFNRLKDPTIGLERVGQGLSERLAMIKVSTLSGIQITNARGVVVATSGQLYGEDLSGEVEVAQALLGQSTAVVKPRTPTRMPLAGESRRTGVRLFVAIPVMLDDEVLGTVVLSRTPRDEIQAMYQMYPGPLLTGTVLSMLATVAFGLYAGFLLTHSLRTVTAATQQIAEGRFDRVDALNSPRSSHVADVANLAGAVQTMADRLQTRLGYITEFASNVSHEFKTPLATLRGTVELLADDDQMPAAQRQRFLENAEAELVRMQHLVEGLLVLARAEEGGDRVVLTLAEWMLDAQQRHPDVAFEVGVGVIKGHPTQLQAVVENLICNAKTHGTSPVTVVAVAAEHQVCIAVRDAGTGISEANLAKVFDRFFTTRRGDGGTGLGLALVRAVIEAHGGRVSARSRRGETVFSVELPAHRP